MAKEFCPRCGCYYDEGVYQCPECGYAVREPPEREFVSAFAPEPPTRDQVDIVSSIFKNKWFYVAMLITAVVCFGITYYWRFSFLFLCFPLLIPMRNFSVTAGVFFGICLGTIIATAVKYYMFGTTPFLW